jgi:uncharacterized membrane protein YkvA (DUF1232 family)
MPGAYWSVNQERRLMNSDDLRNKISETLEHEERTNHVANMLSKHLRQVGVSMTPEQQADCLNFIKAYVRETPDLMDQAFHAAQQAGVLNQLQPILDQCFNYWAEPSDFVPDHLGLIGIADDAYLTRMFLESASSLQAAQSARPLLSVDLAPANRVMRGLIGEPIATALDTTVGQSIAGQVIQAGLQQLTGFGGLNLNLPNYGSYISQYDIDRAVDVKLGSMGVV